MYKQSIFNIWLMSAFIFLSACANGPPKPPIRVPFKLDQSGIKITQKFKIVESRKYNFGFEYLFHAGNDKKSGFIISNNLLKLLNDDMELFDEKPSGKVPLKVRLVIKSDIENKAAFEFNKVISNIVHDGGGEGRFSQSIVNIELGQGIYEASLENLLPTNSFEKYDVNFIINPAYRGK